jgi:nitrite reductase/ring-hydroxylating ferredoxin subunit
MARRERLICASGDVVDGGPGVRFEIAAGSGALPAFVIRFRGAVRAYVNECQHQATQLDWNPGEFFDSERLYLVCATHGALYDPSSGVCVAGPCAGARLATLAVHERDGAVYCVEDLSHG